MIGNVHLYPHVHTLSLSYRNDKIIVLIRRLDNTLVALASSNAWLENFGYNLTTHCMFCSKWYDYKPSWRQRSKRIAERRGSIFGAKLKAWRHKKVSYFSHFAFWYNFWSSKSVFMNIKCRFLWEKDPYFNTYPNDMHLPSRQLSFSRLLNPDRSVQLAGPPAVCKVYPRAHTLHKLHDKTVPNN